MTTTILSKLLLPAILFAVWVPAASAWSWPIQGPVLRPFSYDEAHPYAAGQHRGLDIGAEAAGENVVAPAAGTVSFAGTVPTNGKSVTIETADGYSVTLTHLGAIRVVKGAMVGEQDTIGTVGPSGTPEEVGPYVHLGIRVTADPNGYVDPLSLLPSVSSGATPGDSTASQTSSSSSPAAPASGQGGSADAPGTSANEPTAPDSATPRVATTRGSTVSPGRADARARVHQRAQESRASARQGRKPQLRSGGKGDARVSHHAAAPQRRASRPTSSSQPPVVETAALGEPTGLNAGHEIRSGLHGANLPPPRSAGAPLSLVLNAVAALVALAAAFATGRRRRALPRGIEDAQVVHLSPPTLERRVA